ncbi:hypothetical protein [Leisingera sp. M523]|uniref:hypothetical protein n=1 Tax=Leisingera sp. M523 TaxID=2867013 RepID=UPI0021A7B5A8|nr:hypothetical protein [Leisingera sp. M523]UWQ30221.1 hypothetical protein K3557_06710 [Leisingera sp. M523]
MTGPDKRGSMAHVFEAYNTRQKRRKPWLAGWGAALTIAGAGGFLAVLLGQAWLQWMLHETCPF